MTELKSLLSSIFCEMGEYNNSILKYRIYIVLFSMHTHLTKILE